MDRTNHAANTCQYHAKFDCTACLRQHEAIAICWSCLITFCNESGVIQGTREALAAQEMLPCTEVIDTLEVCQDVQQVLQVSASYSMQAAPHLKPHASVLQLHCKPTLSNELQC